MVKPLQSGPSMAPQSLPTCLRPCSLMMRASLELKQQLLLECSRQPKMVSLEQYSPTSWHSPAPFFSASLPSSSLQEVMLMMICTAITKASDQGSKAIIICGPCSITTSPASTTSAPLVTV